MRRVVTLNLLFLCLAFQLTDDSFPLIHDAYILLLHSMQKVRPSIPDESARFARLWESTLGQRVL